MIVLGLDPGLAKLGWTHVRLHEDTERVLTLGVIRTVKGSGKGVLVTDDLHRRGQQLARELEQVLELYPVGCVCAESISYPRSASVCAQIGRAWGVIDALLERRKLPLISASPQALKKEVTGRNKASKDDVLEALDARYGGRVGALLRANKIGKTAREHPVDAVGAVVASLHHDHLRLARSVAAQRQQTLWGVA